MEQQAFRNKHSGVGKRVPQRPPGMNGEQLIQWVLENKAYIDKESGCWIWEGVVQERGRAVIYHEGKNHMLYKLAWEVYNNKPFPKGLQAGHTCEHNSPAHTRCFNPHHIKPMTAQENEASKPLNQCEEYKERQRQHQLNLTKRMPSGLTHKERVDWILENVYEEDENGCLIYQGQIGEDGYGRRNINYRKAEGSQSVATTSDGKKKVEIHRYIHFILNDIDYCNPPKDMVVHHTCANRACGNPEHLELITRSQNQIEARQYSRATSALTEEDVIAVCWAWVHERKDFQTDFQFCRTWGPELGVDPRRIMAIVCERRSWKDIATPILGEKNNT